ncbi:hypothetical protein GCM10011504_51140 [Siccirubricoccus deserti]|nr:hypothetical protein GCM10011504_51140 [Siccirubricoccus deserti]
MAGAPSHGTENGGRQIAARQLRVRVGGDEALHRIRDPPDERALNRPSLAAHRPLGRIMQTRLRAYPALSAWRRGRNGIPAREPYALDEVPDWLQAAGYRGSAFGRERNPL